MRGGDLYLHQLCRQVIGIIAFQVSGKRTGLIDVAKIEVCLGHEVEAGARIRFLHQHLFQILDRSLQVGGLSRLRANACAQQQRLPVMLILLQNFIGLGQDNDADPFKEERYWSD